MIPSGTVIDAKLHKKHGILSLHFDQRLFACGYSNLQHVKSEYNLADILTKHWGYQSTYELIRPIFHDTGNTASLFFDDTFEVDRSMTSEDIITINGEC